MKYPSDNRAPLSEEYRIAAEEWVAADALARLLEETRSSERSRRMLMLGTDMPVNRAQLLTEGSSAWLDYLTGMVNAKTEANRLRVRVDYIKMRHAEQQSEEANKRAEMRL